MKTPKTPSPPSELGLERIVFFSDAVMAIAITLLAIDLKIPEAEQLLDASEFQQAILALMPRMISFVISFMVIGVYWSSHHRYFNLIERYDRGLIALNLVFLLFIAVMPFVASLLGQYPQFPLAVSIYAAAVTCTGFSLSALWIYASQNHRLVDQRLDENYIRTHQIVTFSSPLVFLASIPLAFVNPVLAQLFWFLATLVAFIVTRLRRRTSKGTKHSSAKS